MALYYPVASAASKPAVRRSVFSFDSSTLFRFGRLVGIVLLGSVVMHSPELGARHVDVGWMLMVGVAPLSALIDYVMPERHRLAAQTVFDVIGVVVGAALLPGVWYPALVLGALMIGGSVPRFAASHKFTFALLPAAFVLAMAVIADQFQIPGANLSLLAIVIGTPFCFLFALREQRREQQLLERSNLMDSLARMAGGIGHDFNNLLTGVQGNAELAEQRLDRNHVARPFLQALLAESQKAQLFSAQLLAFSGGVATGRERLDVRAELLGIAGLLESALPRGVQLQIRADDDLPLVSANRAQLQEIVVAGIVHVADAIEVVPSEVRIGLRRVQRRYGDELVVQLRGTTVPANELTPAGYQPVPRQNLTSLRFGLTSAQQIMREHDGDIDVHGNRREGRVITLRLPGLPDTRSAPVRPVAPSRTVPRHVLLLESTPEIREVVRSLLVQLGHKVTSAESDTDVLTAIAQDRSIDVVMLDAPAPLSRILLSRIDNIRPGMPALLPESARERVGEWVGRPNVNYVSKPFSSASLNGAIKRLFDPQRS